MATINLPVKSIFNVIDIDNRNVLVSVEDAINTLAENAKEPDKPSGIRTMYAAPTVQGSNTNFNFNISYLNKIYKKTITEFNKDIKYWQILFKFYNDISIEFLVPGFVKFYSLNNEKFVPVEYMKKSDILTDYKGDMVQVVKKTELTDIDLTNEEYYSFLINCNNYDYNLQFYLNGILASIPYNPYDKE